MNEREAELYDLIFDDDEEYGRGANRVHEIIQRLNPQAQSLLDVGCGPGRHLSYLRQWYRAEGLDISEVMLEQAQRRLPGIALTLGNMQDFDLGRRFDAIICLASAIVAMSTEQELRQAIRNMANHLNENGVLIIEPWDLPEEHDPNAEPYVTSYEEEGKRIVMMEITTLRDNVWRQDSHYLIGTSDQIEHMTVVSEFPAYNNVQHLRAFEEAGLQVSRDPIGLLGRGLYIGVKQT